MVAILLRYSFLTLRTWVRRLQLRVKPLPHWSHLNFFTTAADGQGGCFSGEASSSVFAFEFWSFLCFWCSFFVCLFSTAGHENFSSQIGQVTGFLASLASPLLWWFFTCKSSLSLKKKSLLNYCPQELQIMQGHSLKLKTWNYIIKTI